MGSRSHSLWIILAACCGVLYLIFDAARSFVQRLSAVRLRRLNADADGQKRRWLLYDARTFQLISGALLQIALIAALVSTIMIWDEWPIGTACFIGSSIWIGITMAWKIVTALVPEDTTETLLRGIIPFSHFFYYLFWPFLFPLRNLLDRLHREEEEDDDGEEVTDEEVQAYIDVGEEEGILEASEGKLLQSIVDFSDRLAHELMTPRIDLQAFEASGSLRDLAQMFSDSKYARIPIYRESIDTITGIVHIKDLFEAILKNEETSIAALARPPYFVPETKNVSDLLREFQSEHLQVAVVVDEFGGTAGLITIEDVVEDIVGDISDEHEDEESSIVDLGSGQYLVSGLLRVETLEEVLHAHLSGDDYETVAGLIFTSLGRVPSAGKVVRKNGYLFTVDRADRKRIYRVRVATDPEWRREQESEEES